MKCNRTVCTNEADDCVHRDTGKLYCRPCALNINRVNNQIVIVIPKVPYVKHRIENQGSIGEGGTIAGCSCCRH